jgi:F-type H+-transporting ATPase subunit a
MADPILHIKDSYFFEVPKFAWQRHYHSRTEFPDVWVRNDPDYQQWEAQRLYAELAKIVSQYNASGAVKPPIQLPPRAELFSEWQHWLHEPPKSGEAARHGKPLDVYLEHNREDVEQEYRKWTQGGNLPSKSFDAFLAEHPADNAWFLRLAHYGDGFDQKWESVKERAENVEGYKKDPNVSEWSTTKLTQYNFHLSGKVLIPQPFGKLRNLHERESGLAISKYMIIELLVAILLFVLFRWLAVRLKSGDRPKGRLWNLLEVFLLYIRDQVARPAIGHHDADRFVPLLWTIFMFILFCNLFGMLPMFGAPTAVFGVTFAMALVAFGAVVTSGMRRFGPVGYFLNQVPHMDLPWYMAILIKPLVFAIEILGLLIRHGVLAVRLLANMAAGHLVILGIMAAVFGTAAAIQFAGAPTWQWGIGAVVVVIGSALFSLLELFVAFLQAYIFTFLTALFIGAAIHHH